MTRDPLLYLDDMLNYARAAHEFVEGVTAEAFIEDTRTRYAVSYALSVIGEAARNVPAAIRERYPQIPWQDIIGMRNRLAHDYLGTRHDIVYATAREFAPRLIALLPPIITELEVGAGDKSNDGP